MKKKSFFIVFALVAMSVLQTSAQLVATMDDLPLEAGSYWNGSDGSGNFTSGPMTFINQYNPDFYFWTGFAYSNTTDINTTGYSNQYSAFAGKGALESANYAIGYTYGPDTIVLNKPDDMFGLYVTNSTYAALSMQNGDEYSKKFGGITGNDEDWFKLTITSLDIEKKEISKVEYYLADYRFSDNSQDYIIKEWQWIDLSILKSVSYLTFELSSSDNGEFGMNTPAYFCLDQVTLKDFTTITFKVDDGSNALEGVSVDLDGLTLTTDINGIVVFEAISPTIQMDVKATKSGYGTYNTKINGYYTAFQIISLIPNRVEDHTQVYTQIFPNPAREQVLVKCDSEIQYIRIMNLAGLTIMNFACNGMTEQKVSLINLHEGVYMIQVKSHNENRIQKIVKQ